MILLTSSGRYICSHISRIWEKNKNKHVGIDSLSRGSGVNISFKKNFIKGELILTFSDISKFKKDLKSKPKMTIKDIIKSSKNIKFK